MGINTDEKSETRGRGRPSERKTGSHSSLSSKPDKFGRESPNSMIPRSNGEPRPLNQKRALSRQRQNLGEDGGLKSRPSTSSSTHNKTASIEKARADKAQLMSKASLEKARTETPDVKHEPDNAKASNTPGRRAEEGSNARKQSFMQNVTTRERETTRLKSRRYYRSLSASPPKVRMNPGYSEPTESDDGRGWKETQAQAETIARLQAELLQKEEEIGNLQQQLKEADEDLQSLKIDKKYHISDDQLRREWNALKYKIQTHTNQRFISKPATWPSNLVEGLTDKAAEFMTNSVTRRKLFEAVIWRFLVENVFSLDGLVWAGSSHEHLKALSHMFVEHVNENALSREEYNSWRAKSAVMLSHTFRHSSLPTVEYARCRMDDLTLELENMLRPYQNSGYDMDARPHTGEIIGGAIEIDICLRQSRAEYLVFMYHPIEAHDFSRVSEVDTYGFEFNDLHMEREDGGRSTGANSPRVHLVVSPVVLKRGNAEGDRYDQQTVISKRGVLCK
ncbi:uncharacterized protein F4822DRAFT_444744 [Hypoxylon trugodes]|uniref:uncharacterized protein n=1 Tax=Hypoxylon trugodes TaxID=326681 RepID=UPI002191DD1F|nr:uncharacterized protein F4822DRAFT_444744 [Hypoxylon trugodes]KAI1386330.1 hypothetical protein F4822DRAFT_444744 [Hypoxylon trugodes]